MTILKKQATYHHGTLKEAILDSAAVITARNGGLDFSMRDISKECKVTAPAIYKHYKSKNELAVFMAYKAVNLLKDEFDKISKLKKSSLLQYCKAYIDFARKNEGYFRAMYHRPIGEMKEYKQVENTSEQLNAYILAILDPSLNSKQKIYHSKRILVAIHGIATLIIDGCMDIENSEIDKLLKDNLHSII